MCLLHTHSNIQFTQENHKGKHILAQMKPWGSVYSLAHAFSREQLNVNNENPVDLIIFKYTEIDIHTKIVC